MECKYHFSRHRDAIRRIKIETYWNVNTYEWQFYSCRAGIKIETYWNVNESEQQARELQVEIKIETYWNVNTGTYPDIDKYALLK